jgi:hypothetical protein
MAACTTPHVLPSTNNLKPTETGADLYADVYWQKVKIKNVYKLGLQRK